MAFLRRSVQVEKFRPYLPPRIVADGRDTLTGLLDRVAIADICADWPKPYGLVVLNLPGFVYVNDKQGHNFGDALLVWMSMQLALRVPPEPFALVSRSGGDEFVVALRQPEHIERLVATLRDLIETPVAFVNSSLAAFKDNRLQLQLRGDAVGTALCLDGDGTFDEAMNLARAELLRIKSQSVAPRRPEFTDLGRR